MMQRQGPFLEARNRIEGVALQRQSVVRRQAASFKLEEVHETTRRAVAEEEEEEEEEEASRGGIPES